MMDDTKARLKRAGMKLFLERGYAGTSIAALEEEAGLAPRAGGFYRHFESKEALAVAIAREEIVERKDEFGFADLFPLHDTHAELLLIARVYMQANKRQRKYYNLIQELRKLPALQSFEQEASTDLFDWLAQWVAGKPAAENTTGTELAAYTLSVFGGLLFYTTKRLQGVSLPRLKDGDMIAHWAKYWAGVLDSPHSKTKDVRRRV